MQEGTLVGVLLKIGTVHGNDGAVTHPVAFKLFRIFRGYIPDLPLLEGYPHPHLHTPSPALMHALRRPVVRASASHCT